MPIRERVPSGRAVVIACGRALRRLAPLVFLLALGGGAAYGARAGWHFFMTSPRFAVTHVDVVGAHAMSADEVRADAPVHLGDNVFQVDLAAIDAALAQEPWIAGVAARRDLPHGVVIEVRERQAAALVALDAMYLSDDQGRLFKRARADEGVGLPVITGLTRDDVTADDAAAADRIRHGLAVLAAWGTARPAIGEIHVDPQGAVTLYSFDSAVAIRLGTADGTALAARLDTFDAAWASLSSDERSRARALQLDLDSRPDQVTVAFSR